MDIPTSRFIAINLTESEWRALRSIEPNPTAWVKEQITRRLEDAGVVPAAEPEPKSRISGLSV